MNKKGQITVGTIIVLAMVIFIGVAFLTPIFSSQSKMTTKQTTTNQSVDTASAYLTANSVNESVNFTIYSQSDWKVSNCPLTSVVLRNGAGTALVANTDYTLYANQGVFSLLNTTKTAPSTSLNTTYVDYTYCADGYITDSGGRGVAGLIGIFAVIMLFAFVVWKSNVIESLGLFR